MFIYCSHKLNIVYVKCSDISLFKSKHYLTQNNSFYWLFLSANSWNFPFFVRISPCFERRASKCLNLEKEKNPKLSQLDTMRAKWESVFSFRSLDEPVDASLPCFLSPPLVLLPVVARCLKRVAQLTVGQKQKWKSFGFLTWLPISLASNPCSTVWIWLCGLSWAHDCEVQDSVLYMCVYVFGEGEVGVSSRYTRLV